MASIRSRIGENMEDRYLFKAKRIDNGEWEIGSLIALPTGEYEISNKCNNPPDCDHIWNKVVITHKVKPSTICQCTGLKDKNGKLIWENDILDGFTYPYMSDDAHNYYAEVCWCNNVPSFGIYTQKYPESKVSGISAGMTELMEDWNPNDWEVIGNIFDNPVLLESEE